MRQYSYKGDFLNPACRPTTARAMVCGYPIYVGATGPFMQRLASRSSDGMLLAGLTSPKFVEYAIDNMKKGAEKKPAARWLMTSRWAV